MSLNKIHEDFLNIERPNYIDVLGDDINLSDLGWITYSDTAAVNPTDGIGGTANITFAKNLMNPLSGTFDLRLTKDAANRQGQGFSIPFVISNIHLGKILQITFDMELISGTYSTGDLRVSIIQDPTGTPVLSEPVNTNLVLGTANQRMRHIATFQSSISVTSYRLCIHVSSVSTSAYVVDFANFRVWEPTQSIGSVITDWQSYTPTLISFGTTTNQDFQWRRVGGNMEIQGKWTAGTSTGVEARIPLPFGTIDSTRIPNIRIVGTGGYNASASTYFGTYILAEPSVSYLTMGIQTSTVNALTKVNGSTMGNNTYAMFASVPIAGWGSSVSMSSDSGDGRVVACYYNTGANITVSPSTPIRYTNRIYDTHNAYDTTNGKFTAPVSGFYNVKGSLRQGTTTDYFVLYKGTSVYQRLAIWNSGDTYNLYNGVIQLNAGETLEIRTEIGSVSISSASIHYFAVERISAGSQTIASVETVACEVVMTSSNNPGTDQPIRFNSVVRDTHSAYNTSTFRYTIPMSGWYQINFIYNISTGGHTTEWVYLFVNGTRNRTFLYLKATPDTDYYPGSITAYFLSGDIIDIRSAATTAPNFYGDPTNNTRTRMTVHRIGI